MTRGIWPWIVGLTLLVPAVVLVLLLLPPGSAEGGGDPAAPTFDERFWQSWGDGVGSYRHVKSTKEGRTL